MSRFSPEFAAKLRHRAQQVARSPDQFKRMRQAFGAWVAEYQNMMVINAFAAHYNDHMKPHYAISSQDNTTETYCAPEAPHLFMGVCATPEPILMEEDSPFRLPPGRHIVPILFRRRAVEVNDSPEERPPTMEEQAVSRVRMTMELMARHGVEIPRDQWPAWLESEPGL